MSLFENPSVSPSRLRGVYRFLLRAPEQKEGRDRLGRILMPESALGDSGRATLDRTLLEGRGMRLLDEVEEDGEAYVTLHPDLPAEARDIERGDDLLTDLLCTLLLKPENKRNSELAYTVAWFLAQNPLKAVGDWDSVRRAVDRTGCREITGLTNDTRYRQAKYWMMFLGLAWEDGLGDQIIPDPTKLLRRNLKLLFQEPQDWRSLPNALRRLAEQFPVFEGGRYRDRIEKISGERQPQHLSAATAQALLRLRDEGSIDLETRSDDPGLRVFPGSDGAQRFSHARWTP